MGIHTDLAYPLCIPCLFGMPIWDAIVTWDIRVGSAWISLGGIHVRLPTLILPSL